MTKTEKQLDEIKDKLIKGFSEALVKQLMNGNDQDDQDDQDDEDCEDEDEGQDARDPLSMLRQMLGNLSASSREPKDFKAEQEKVDAELKKVPEFREYREFLDWAFGPINGGQPVDFAEGFAKLHPDLPTIKIIEHQYANRDANLGAILFQAAKYYFEDKYGIEFKTYRKRL